MKTWGIGNRLQRDSAFNGSDVTLNTVVVHLFIDDGADDKGVIPWDMCNTIEKTQEWLHDAYTKNDGSEFEVKTTIPHYFSWRYADKLKLSYGGKTLSFEMDKEDPVTGRMIREYIKMETLLFGGEWDEALGISKDGI